MYCVSLEALTVFEASKKRPGDKRKKERNIDPADVDGFLGPWAKYEGEQTVMKPSAVSYICLTVFSDELYLSHSVLW